MLCKKKEMSDIADIFDAYDGEDEDVEEDDSLLWLVKIFLKSSDFSSRSKRSSQGHKRFVILRFAFVTIDVHSH